MWFDTIQKESDANHKDELEMQCIVWTIAYHMRFAIRITFDDTNAIYNSDTDPFFYSIVNLTG
jgi:hypothetical protein